MELLELAKTVEWMKRGIQEVEEIELMKDGDLSLVEKNYKDALLFDF